MENTVSTSAGTIRGLHMLELSGNASSSSQPSSPRSSTLPSPPDSPSSDHSVSSFPSVSSSFFFSSGAASSPHSHEHSDHARDSTQGLIIPSLTLPSALRRPTAYGQTLGDIKLLLLGSKGVGKTVLAGLLVDGNEDVVDVGSWEEAEHGVTMRASTDWIEHKDAHGLEKFEPARNIEIVEFPGYEHDDDAKQISASLLSAIQAPFHFLMEVIHGDCAPSPVLANLLSSPMTPLYTALILLLTAPPSPLERAIIDDLSAHIPIIVLPPLVSQSRYPSMPKLSAFRPMSAITLKQGLFRSPETLSSLRSEATDRFLRWREVERAVHAIKQSSPHKSKSKSRRPSHADAKEKKKGHESAAWSKAQWESEWESTLSRDVAQRLRDRSDSRSKTGTAEEDESDDLRRRRWSCTESAYFDPLHLPSLFIFTLSLFGPRQSTTTGNSGAASKLTGYSLGLALVGAFCAGIGIGYLFLK